MTNEKLVKELNIASIQCDQMRLQDFGYLMKIAADAVEQLETLNEFWQDMANNAKKLLEDKLPKWIPVTERLPQDAGIYIICDHYGNVMSRHFCKSHGKFAGYWHFNGSAKYGNPTHWMPLPEPPKEVEE